MTTDKQARKLKAELRVIRSSVELFVNLKPRAGDVVSVSTVVKWARDVLREAEKARKDIE